MTVVENHNFSGWAAPCKVDLFVAYGEQKQCVAASYVQGFKDGTSYVLRCVGGTVGEADLFAVHLSISHTKAGYGEGYSHGVCHAIRQRVLQEARTAAQLRHELNQSTVERARLAESVHAWEQYAANLKKTIVRACLMLVEERIVKSATALTGKSKSFQPSATARTIEGTT